MGRNYDATNNFSWGSVMFTWGIGRVIYRHFIFCQGFGSMFFFKIVGVTTDWGDATGGTWEATVLGGRTFVGGNFAGARVGGYRGFGSIEHQRGLDLVYKPFATTLYGFGLYPMVGFCWVNVDLNGVFIHHLGQGSFCKGEPSGGRGAMCMQQLATLKQSCFRGFIFGVATGKRGAPLCGLPGCGPQFFVSVFSWGSGLYFVNGRWG